MNYREGIERSYRRASLIRKAKLSARGSKASKARKCRSKAGREQWDKEVQDYLSRNPKPWSVDL